jgi:hypothetical protein
MAQEIWPAVENKPARDSRVAYRLTVTKMEIIAERLKIKAEVFSGRIPMQTRANKRTL